MTHSVHLRQRRNYQKMKSDSKLKVDKWVYDELKRIVELKPWNIQVALTQFFVDLDPIEKRTGPQNRGLHLFFTQLAEALNMAGLEMKVVLKADTEIWWNGKMVKEYLWRPLQKAMFGKESTKDLEKQVEINQTHEQLMHLLGEKHGVEWIDFPKKAEEVKETKVEYPDYQGKTAFDD